MGSDLRQLDERGPLRDGRLIVLGCAVFALLAVLSARGYESAFQGDPVEAPPETPYYSGDEIDGTRGVDLLRGTASDDLLFGFGAADTVYGEAGSDLIDAGNGDDLVYAGSGNDRVRAFDADRDVIHCGSGTDTAFVDANDRTVGCEEIVQAADFTLPATPSPP